MVEAGTNGQKQRYSETLLVANMQDQRPEAAGDRGSLGGCSCVLAGNANILLRQITPWA